MGTKQTIRLNEAQLHNIIAGAVRGILKEEESKPFFKGRPRASKGPDINSKRTAERFAWNDRHYLNKPMDMDSSDKEAEAAAEEFLNRPNAAQDYEHFPRYGRGHKKQDPDEYNSFKGGTEKIRNFKTKREKEQRDREEMDLQKLIEKARGKMRKIAYKVVSSKYEPESITEEDIKFMEKLIRENESTFKGKLFPEYEIEPDTSWFNLLVSVIDDSYGYNPYKVATLAHKLGFAQEPPQSKELDVDFLPPSKTNDFGW